MKNRDAYIERLKNLPTEELVNLLYIGLTNDCTLCPCKEQCSQMSTEEFLQTPDCEDMITKWMEG